MWSSMLLLRIQRETSCSFFACDIQDYVSKAESSLKHDRRPNLSVVSVSHGQVRYIFSPLLPSIQQYACCMLPSAKSASSSVVRKTCFLSPLPWRFIEVGTPGFCTQQLACHLKVKPFTLEGLEQDACLSPTTRMCMAYCTTSLQGVGIFSLHEMLCSFVLL